MGQIGLKSAFDRGEPLVDVVISFRAGVDPVHATERINIECEDIDLYPRPWYDQPRLRIATATRDALERVFGIKLERVQLKRYDETTKTWGYWSDTWTWKQISGPDLELSDLSRLVEEIGLSQPGQGDGGQPCERAPI